MAIALDSTKLLICSNLANTKFTDGPNNTLSYQMETRDGDKIEIEKNTLMFFCDDPYIDV